MTKVTYTRKHTVGVLLTVSEGESMTIMAGAWQQRSRHGAGAIAESLHLTYKHVAGGRGVWRGLGVRGAEACL